MVLRGERAVGDELLDDLVEVLVDALTLRKKYARARLGRLSRIE